MKTILKLEETAMFAIGIYLLSQFNLGLPVWVWGLLFFTPDISMLGYVINTKTGAILYNFFHHKAIAIALAISGYYFNQEIVTAIGLLLFAHASFDRIMGYGLKFEDSFSSTHLGKIGKNK